MATGGSADADMAAGGSADADICTKRRAEGNEAAEENGIAAKNIKLEDSNDDQPTPSLSSSGSGSSANDSISSSQHSVSSSLPSGRAESQNGTTGVQSPSTSPEKKSGHLTLRKGKAFNQMLAAFSEDEYSLPISITYEYQGYNLTPAFEEFWEELCHSHIFSFGHYVKLLKKDLEAGTLLSIARVLRRGWEDQKYFPTKIVDPFLEACIFNREVETDIQFTSRTFQLFIEPSEHEIFKRNENNTVDEECLQIFKQYCPNSGITVGTELESAYITALRCIMFRETERIRKIWTPELVGLMEWKEFKFLLKQPTVDTTIKQTMEIMMYDKSPHRIWNTFFYQWDKDTIEFYYKLINNDSFNLKCQGCDKTYVDAKTLVSPCCGYKLRTKLRDRHDCVLKLIAQELNRAIEKRTHYFSSGRWNRIIMHGNLRGNVWPKEIYFLGSANKYPHIVAYSMSPSKKALVIEITISWEKYVFEKTLSPYDKTERYKTVSDMLEKRGFETTFRNIKIGSRGAFSPDVYDLFEKDFGMKHGNISKVMEQISRKIIEATYNYYYPSE